MARQTQNMIKYIFKRILIMFPMLMMVLLATWFLSQMMAVNPVSNKIGFTLDPDLYELEKIKMGWYDPWYVKLGKYIGNFFTGNWGESYLVDFEFTWPHIAADSYAISIAIAEGDQELHTMHHWIHDVITIEVMRTKEYQFGLVGVEQAKMGIKLLDAGISLLNGGGV